MKNMNLFLGVSILLCLSGLGYLVLNSPCGDSFLTIPFEAKWDVSKKDSSITRAFSVSTGRFYEYSILFKISESEKDISKASSQLEEITGDGNSLHPGITIPIHIKVAMLETGQEVTVFDKTVDTKKLYFSGYREKTREIWGEHLAPGKYIVTASTIEDTALPDWVDTYLSVSYYPK